MIQIKEVLYLLALKTYLIDGKQELSLDDEYVLKIETIEDFKWQYCLDELLPLCTISFFVIVKSEKEKYQIIYKKKTRRNLSILLNSTLEEKTEFILRKKKGLFVKNYYEEPNRIINLSKNMKKVILKKFADEMQAFRSEKTSNEKAVIKPKVRRK